MILHFCWTSQPASQPTSQCPSKRILMNFLHESVSFKWLSSSLRMERNGAATGPSHDTTRSIDEHCEQSWATLSGLLRVHERLTVTWWWCCWCYRCEHLTCMVKPTYPAGISWVVGRPTSICTHTHLWTVLRPPEVLITLRSCHSERSELRQCSMPISLTLPLFFLPFFQTLECCPAHDNNGAAWFMLHLALALKVSICTPTETGSCYHLADPDLSALKLEGSSFMFFLLHTGIDSNNIV